MIVLLTLVWFWWKFFPAFGHQILKIRSRNVNCSTWLDCMRNTQKHHSNLNQFHKISTVLCFSNICWPRLIIKLTEKWNKHFERECCKQNNIVPWWIIFTWYCVLAFSRYKHRITSSLCIAMPLLLRSSNGAKMKFPREWYYQ